MARDHDDINDDMEDSVELSDRFEDELDDQDDDQDDQDEVLTAQERAGNGKPSAKDRIKELAEKRRAAEQAQLAAEMRAIELERRLEALEKGAERAPAAVKKPDPADFRYGEVDPDFVEATVNYRVWERDQAESETRRQQEAQRTEAETATHYRKRLTNVLTEGKKKYRGFEDAVMATDYEPALARLVLDSDRAVDIAYHLSKNGSDLLALTRANPQERLRILGRLEGSLSAASAAKKVTKAPPAMGRKPKRQSAGDGKYGPDDQDAFDRAFFSR